MAESWRFTHHREGPAPSPHTEGGSKTSTIKKKKLARNAGSLPQLVSAPLRKSKKAFNDPSGHNVICIFILSGQAHGTKGPGVEGNLFESCWQREMLSDVEGRKNESVLWKLAGD